MASGVNWHSKLSSSCPPNAELEQLNQKCAASDMPVKPVVRIDAGQHFRLTEEINILSLTHQTQRAIVIRHYFQRIVGW